MNQEAMAGVLSALKEYFDRSTRVLDEADSTFAPREGMFTASQLVAHAAQTLSWFIQGAFAPEGFDLDFERMDKEVRATTSIQAARAWMDKACQEAQAAVRSHGDAEWASLLPPGPIMGGLPRHAIWTAVLDHTAHHRGALTVYSRLLGKVPAMPYMDA
jgi:uncharacterized damage-inducible protein DinB